MWLFVHTAAAACLHQGNLQGEDEVRSGTTKLAADRVLSVGHVELAVPAETRRTVSCDRESFALREAFTLGGVPLAPGPVGMGLLSAGQTAPGSRVVSAILADAVVLADGTEVAGLAWLRCEAACEVIGGTVGAARTFAFPDDVGDTVEIPAGAHIFTTVEGDTRRTVVMGALEGTVRHRKVQSAYFFQESPTFWMGAACTGAGSAKVDDAEGAADCEGTFIARNQLSEQDSGPSRWRSLRGRVVIRARLEAEEPLSLVLHDTDVGHSLQLTFGNEPVATASFSHPIPFDLLVVDPRGSVDPAQRERPACRLDTLEVDVFPTTTPGFACWMGEGDTRKRVLLD